MKHSKKRERKNSAGRVVRIFGLAFLLVFLIFLLAVLGYSIYLLGLMQYVEDKNTTISPQKLTEYLEEQKEDPDEAKDLEAVDESQINWDTVTGDAMKNDTVINILLIGQDARPGEYRARSDAMLLCSYDIANQKLTVVSFMRDLYVTIPGYVDHKLNSAYAWGGITLLNETILTNFGIQVDGNMAVDFDAFQRVIDLLGGVDIYLTAEEATYLNAKRFYQGMNHLNGAEALTYARIRSIGDGDFSRTGRQQNVIQAVVKQCEGLNLSQLHRLLEQVLPLVSTDMEPVQLLEYVSEALPLISGQCKIERIRIPADGAYRYAWVSEMSVLLPDLPQNRKILQQVLYGK